MVLGAILGPLAETSFMTTMISFSNDWTVFFTRPVSGSIMAMVGLALIYPLVSEWAATRRRQRSRVEASTS
jgi:putative tricarboxylic transport membrane protein